MPDGGDRGVADATGRLQQVLPPGFQFLGGHPHEHGVHVVGTGRHLIHADQQVTPADVDLVDQGDGDGPPRTGDLEIAVECDNARHRRPHAGGQGHHPVAGPEHAGGHRAGEAPEVEVGSDHHLDRQAQALQVDAHLHIDRLQVFHQGWSIEPGEVVTRLDHVVALQCRHREEVRIDQFQALGELPVVAADLVEARLRPSDEVHLVDGHHDVSDAQQADDVAVASGLGQDSQAGVDQDDGQLACGGTGDHVARVLLVSGGVGDDELPPGRGEVPVGHVDRDPLLPLGLQAVHEER